LYFFYRPNNNIDKNSSTIISALKGGASGQYYEKTKKSTKIKNPDPNKKKL